jgi:hypothetical protein
LFHAKAGLSWHEVPTMMGRSPNFMIKCESGDRSIDVMEVVELTRIYQKRVNHLFVDKG